MHLEVASEYLVELADTDRIQIEETAAADTTGTGR